MTKVTKVAIEKFRGLRNIEVPIGEKLTLIAGQNGTMKSTLLGLISCAFDFEKKIILSNKPVPKAVDGRSFNKLFKEVILWQTPKYEKAGDHKYSVFILEDGSTKEKELIVKSYARSQNGNYDLRLVVGKTRKPGEGHYPHPVLFLSMNRFYPIVDMQGKYKLINKVDLTEEESAFLKDNHNEILLLMNSGFDPEYLKTNINIRKSYFGGRTKTYDTRGFSAGQDSISQILSSILSFKRLEEELGSEFRGGLLFIDELEASLFPASQKKLIAKLIYYANEYSIQIIATTHSLDVLRYVMVEKQYKDHAKVVYLSKPKGSIKFNPDIKYDAIERDMMVVPTTEAKQEEFRKVDVLCEDEVAKIFIKKLLGTKICKLLNIDCGSKGVSINQLNILSKLNLRSFKSVIYVVDGEGKDNLKNNVISLPGAKAPERVIYDYLIQLPEDHAFWEDTGGYTKQVCFRDHPPEKMQSINSCKTWYKKERVNWGRECFKVLNYWKEDNPTLVEDFINKFELVFNKVSVIPFPR